MDRFFYNLECFLKKSISRKRFLQFLFGGIVYFIAENRLLKAAFAKTTASDGRPKKNIKGSYDLVMAEGPDPYKNTVEAVEKMGGMGRFVKKGDIVVVKPNIAWDRVPAQAGNTDPTVVAALVDMAYKAGAKRVNVFDIPCNNERLTYENSGIEKAAREHGARVYYADTWNVANAHFSYTSPMEGWPILKDAIDCDVFINVPVLKHHGLTKLTLSMKNLMGVCAGTRGLIHMDIGRKLADLTDFISPDLTVIDATRVLLRHGPQGGSLEDVEKMDKVIVATDPVLADAFACTLVNTDPMSIGYIKIAADRKQGSADIGAANVVEIKT
jgi:uncharacterized protein (DUF362 family)